MTSPLVPGLTGEARTVVAQENLASTYGSGLVDVFATPAMVALMENAAVVAVQGTLPPGSVTVGSALEVRHLAATPLGMEVRARAELVEVDGRKLVFHVEAFDPVEKIGEGRHERHMVERERFLARVARKQAGA